MRASKNSSSNASSDDIRARYLGEIAPLLDAAREIDSLSPAQTKQVRRRIVRTLFRTRLLSFRVRLVPVLAALGMLVIGGAAFATAERLGLLPKLGTKAPTAPAAQPKQETRKHRGSGTPPAAREGAPGAPVATVSEATPASPITLVLPEVPDPLLFPVAEASTAGWSLLPETPVRPATAKIERAAVIERAADAILETPAKPARRPARLLAYAASAPMFAAPAPVMAAPLPMNAGTTVPREAPAPVSLPVQPSGSPTASLSRAAAAPASAPAAQAALPAPVAPTPLVAKPAPAPHAQLSDQSLFGQAMRKLRTEKNPAAALSALQEHARIYPRSGLVGERNALEVEALLALHRDREALARLDTMAIDELPRSGERFVVRGELRAAAHRWLEASADFDRALARVSGSPAWHERALWGRGAARLRCGEREAGMADIERYLDSYPNGRFASEAAKFFPKK
jgi:tetratricopeptide (TPR) repeat protein